MGGGGGGAPQFPPWRSQGPRDILTGAQAEGGRGMQAWLVVGFRALLSDAVPLGSGPIVTEDPSSAQ